MLQGKKDSKYVTGGCSTTGNYMFKVNDRNTRTRCEICSEFTMVRKFIKKETPILSCEIYEIFKDTFFYRTPLAAASGLPFTFLVIVDCQSKALKFDWQSLFRVWWEQVIRTGELICRNTKYRVCIKFQFHFYLIFWLWFEFVWFSLKWLLQFLFFFDLFAKISRFPLKSFL